MENPKSLKQIIRDFWYTVTPFNDPKVWQLDSSTTTSSR